MSKDFTVDNNTWASNPGNASLKPLVWLFHDLKTIAVLNSFLLGSILLAFNVSAWFLTLAILFLVINAFYWLRKIEHFRSGDSNGGLVVSVNPTLVAVATDLTKKWNGEYPVVKIIECKTLKKVKLGDRIATVALYRASENDNTPHWLDFNPIPLSFATNDAVTLREAIETYDDDQWSDLENRLKEIKKPYKEGLYKSELLSSDWETVASTT